MARLGLNRKWEFSELPQDQHLIGMTYKAIVDSKQPDDAIRLFSKSIGMEWLDADKRADMEEAMAYAIRRKGELNARLILLGDDPEFEDVREVLRKQQQQ